MAQPAYTRIGRYELLTMLGEGGMARVYLAVSRGPVGFNKLVVVKQVRPELAWDREFITMFFDEARIAARLNHPNVVQTYEVVENTGQYLLAMEHLEGQTLSAVLRRIGRAEMPLEEHLWILTEVLQGLDYAHELRDYDGSSLGLVHRDVSPSNVFITYNGEVKLLDFGIAKAAGAISATQKGMTKGKIGYGAPEQFLGQPVDRRADLYSVGVMLWEALARRRRKLADTPAAKFEAVRSGTEWNVRDANPDVPPRLAEICDRAIVHDPNRRYATAGELAQDLQAYLEGCQRRIERRDLAALVAERFANDRVTMNKLIEEQLGGATFHSATTDRPSNPSRSPMPTVADLPAPARSAAFGVVPQWASWMVARRLALGTGLGVTGIALIVAAARTHKAPAPERQPAAPLAEIATAPPPPPAEIAAAPPPPPREVAPATPPPTAESANVRLSVRVDPKGSTIFLDGKKVTGNPFVATMSRDERSHTLRASAPGFVAVDRSVALSSDLDVEISLRAIPASPARPRNASRVEGERRLEPGGDLPRGSNARSNRSIDDKDPYGR